MDDAIGLVFAVLMLIVLVGAAIIAVSIVGKMFWWAFAQIWGLAL